MFISYDLAKSLQRERLARSLSEFENRRHVRVPDMIESTGEVEGGDVIELVFSTRCASDRIGA